MKFADDGICSGVFGYYTPHKGVRIEIHFPHSFIVIPDNYTPHKGVRIEIAINIREGNNYSITLPTRE